MRGAILATVYELFQQEIDELCGPIFCRKGSALAYRAGSDPGSILAQGQRLNVKKPRAKRNGEEVELETYKTLQAYDILCERVLGHLIQGFRRVSMMDCWMILPAARALLVASETHSLQPT